jgi:hypothetical protein
LKVVKMLEFGADYQKMSDGRLSDVLHEIALAN